MPAAARCTPPVTGASSVSMPLAAARLERRCSSCASLVLMSIQVPPGASASRTPPSSATTEATASGDGRQVMMVSDARAVSRDGAGARGARLAEVDGAARVHVVHGEREAGPQQAAGEVSAEGAEPDVADP